jgi:hypothetical protein
MYLLADRSCPFPCLAPLVVERIMKSANLFVVTLWITRLFGVKSTTCPVDNFEDNYGNL